MIDNDAVATTARQLRLILDAIERGNLDASATIRARLEGAATALETRDGIPWKLFLLENFNFSKMERSFNQSIFI